MYPRRKNKFFIIFGGYRRIVVIEEKWNLNFLDYHMEHNLGEKNPKNLFHYLEEKGRFLNK